MNLKKQTIEQSPFYDDSSMKFKEKYEGLRNTGNGDIYLSKKIIYKSDEYTKIIIPKTLNISKYQNLPDLAKTILHYITVALLEYNSPLFVMKVSELTEVLNLKTKKTIYKAINSLIEANYIARSSIKEVYWINHNYYYKGNIIKIKQLNGKN